MEKRYLGLVLLAGCLVLLNIASAQVSDTSTVIVTATPQNTPGIGITAQDVGPWGLLSIGSNTVNNLVTVYKKGGGSAIKTYRLFATASNSGYLKSVMSSTSDQLGSQLRVNGIIMTGMRLEVASGSIKGDNLVALALPLVQSVAYSDKPHNDYRLTITYDVTIS